MNITLEHKKKISSTSTLALNYLEQGKKAPFAILADLQTKGRGRYSHSWNSPKGGLYLSIAPCLKEIASLPAHNIPLLSALIIKFWLQKEKINISLKWPNDLYYAGKKLGGILCEGSFMGSQWKNLVIGIGINIRKTK